MKDIRLFIICLLFAVVLFPAASECRVHFGKRVVVREGVTVNEAVSFGRDVYIRGTVTSDAVSFGGDVVIEKGGVVNGDAISIGGDVIVKDGGKIDNDVISLGGNVDVSPGGDVGGSHITKERFSAGRVMKHIFPHSLIGIGSVIAKNIFLGPFIVLFGTAGTMIGLIFLAIKLLISLFIAAMLTYFFPEKVSVMADYVREDFPKAFLLGLVMTFMMPFILLFLIITLIGIPLIPLVAVIVFFVYLFGSVGIALWVGHIIPESERRSRMINVMLGVLAIGIVKHIPIIGLIVGIILWTSSLGVVLLTKGAAIHPAAVT